MYDILISKLVMIFNVLVDLISFLVVSLRMVLAYRHFNLFAVSFFFLSDINWAKWILCILAYFRFSTTRSLLARLIT